MYAAQIEKSHIGMHGSCQMFERLAKPKAQTREGGWPSL
jgi:hypothetical protein